MVEERLRLVRRGLPQASDPRKSAIFLVLIMLFAFTNPVVANTSISRDDFDVLDALMDTLAMQTANGEAEIAQSSAEGALALVDLPHAMSTLKTQFHLPVRFQIIFHFVIQAPMSQTIQGL